MGPRTPSTLQTSLSQSLPTPSPSSQPPCTPLPIETSDASLLSPSQPTGIPVPQPPALSALQSPPQTYGDAPAPSKAPVPPRSPRPRCTPAFPGTRGAVPGSRWQRTASAFRRSIVRPGRTRGVRGPGATAPPGGRVRGLLPLSPQCSQCPLLPRAGMSHSLGITPRTAHPYIPPSYP